ncbi:hypothetical protein [Novosphingobium sp. HII-3]|uniref:hypothetical protein n=1 Tax=Novosphingobium sp. HII-3 TaxID=2075565 RepID=UPI000CDB0F26|nr:hypothetical protein [Novosphingobium sp. HII-3]
MIKFTHQSTANGDILAVERNGTRATTAIDAKRHAPLSGLATASVAYANGGADAFAKYLPEPALEHVRSNVAPPMLAALGRAMHLASAERRAVAETDARLRAVPESVDMRHEAERRARVAAMDRATQMAFVQSADITDLAALVARGNLAAISPEAFEVAADRYLALAHVERSASHSLHPLRPSLELLSPTGPDMAAAEAAAQASIAQHNDRRAALDEVEQALQNTLSVLAVSLDAQPSDVLDAVLAAS